MNITNGFYNTAEKIDKILEKDSPNFDFNNLFFFISNKAYENYFFKKVDSLKWFCPLKKKGYFDSKNNPSSQPAKEEGYFTIPHWNVLDYLEKVSLKTSQEENKKYADELMQIIRDFTSPKDGEKVDNYRTWWVFTKILGNLPNDKIRLEDIELIQEWYDSKFGNELIDEEIGSNLLPKFLNSQNPNDWEKATKIIDIITTLKETETQYGEKELKTMVKDYWLLELFKKNSDLLGKRCVPEVVEILKERIKQVLNTGESNGKYSYMWLPVVSEYRQNVSLDEPKKFLVVGLGNILLSAAEDEKKTKLILEAFLKEEKEVFKRVALFVISKNYMRYKKVFWNFIKREHFDSLNLRQELSVLLKDNFENFREEEKKKILNFIKQGPQQLQKKDEGTYRANWMQGWLKAIINKGYSDADYLYNKCKEITGRELEHPEFGFYIKPVTWPGEVSPITREKLLQKSNEEIADYLNNFKEDGRGFKQPTMSGLSEILRGAVKEKPDKFTEDLNPFLNTRLVYQYNIIRGFEETWKEKKQINWNMILQYCWDLINKNGFWQNEETYKNTSLKYRNWTISFIADLIAVGTKSDDWAFSKDYFPITGKILVKILKYQESEMKDTKDALTKSINTAIGKTIEALIFYCLRYAREFHNKPEDKDKPKWSNEKVKDVFRRALDKEDDSLEFSVLMSRYLPNLLWLDRDWVTQDINKLFPKRDTKHWNVAMQGYLFNQRVYNDVYKLLKENNHYLKGLEEEFEDERVREYLIQHICVGYLRGIENLCGSDSLFSRLLTEWEEKDIREIISFFWGHRDMQLEDEIRERILKFWQFCCNKLKEKELTEEDNSILSDINLLAVFLKNLKNGKKDWLLQSIPYVNKNHHSDFLLEYLDLLTEENSYEVCEIYLRMLDYTVPSYDKENIKSIIIKLYAQGQKECSNKICNIYGSLGYEFLRPIYEEHNKK